MSYSIGVQGANVAAALANLATAFDEQVLKHQAMHARDRDAALATAEAMAKQLGAQPEGQEVRLSLSGSLGWSGMRDTDAMNVTNANVSATAWFAIPTPPPTASPA